MLHKKRFILMGFLLGILFTGNITAVGPHLNAQETPTETNPLGLTRQEMVWLAAHPVIRVASDPAWEPVEFRDNKGRYRGLSIDYLQRI